MIAGRMDFFEARSVVAINLSAVLPNDREGRNRLIKQKSFCNFWLQKLRKLLSFFPDKK
jgi:hypothetical protein